jgi:GNAT superfamily N-acetyltransferase
LAWCYPSIYFWSRKLYWFHRAVQKTITKDQQTLVNRKLAFGKHIYVDDLVTINNRRSKGVGKAIVNWLSEYAETHECNEIHLDSGVQRFSAHRFYFREKFHICSYHFKVTVSDEG